MDPDKLAELLESTGSSKTPMSRAEPCPSSDTEEGENTEYHTASEGAATIGEGPTDHAIPITAVDSLALAGITGQDRDGEVSSIFEFDNELFLDEADVSVTNGYTSPSCDDP